MKEIEWVNGDDLTPGPWRCTYMLRPELEVLARSMTDYGWLQPIIVQRGTNKIIDGHIRWEVAAAQKVSKTVGGMVPVIYLNCSDVEASFMHARLNRAKGVSTPKQMSRIVKLVLRAKKLSEWDLRKKLAMTREEFDVMADGTLLKHRKISEHKYSRAWVPVEAPSGGSEASIIERPPNADR
jgi:ParB-like chromosome segregation protein Spo0J